LVWERMGIFGQKKSDVKKHYDFGELLGQGNFADVFKSTCKEERLVPKPGESAKIQVPRTVAIKSIDKSKVEDMNDIDREIDIMKMVNHKNIIQLYEVFDEGKKMHLVMELATGGELFDRIVAKSSYTEREAANTIKTLCEALSHLHALKIVHRDLKPENILYQNEEENAPIKVADFGLARTLSSNDMMKTACGTPGYVAPEILNNKGYDSSAVDLWSTGVILYILLCGFPPFYEEELPALFDSILHARYDFPSPWWDGVSDGAKKLVKDLLELDPQKRLTADQVQVHEWIQTAGDHTLAGAKTQLKKYNASRKLRKAALGIIAQQRMEKALKELRLKSEPERAGSS